MLQWIGLYCSRFSPLPDYSVPTSAGCALRPFAALSSLGQPRRAVADHILLAQCHVRSVPQRLRKKS
eukprot:8523156-Alexandrium_andersonii.AAC.1